MRAATGLAGVCAAAFVVCGGEVLANGPLTRLDLRVRHHYLNNLTQHHFKIDSDGSLRVAHWLQSVGQPWIACVTVGGIGLLFTLRTRRIGPLLAAIVALAAAGFSTLALKEFFPRPSIYFQWPGSFPSGHTVVAVISAGLIARLLIGSTQHRWTRYLDAIAVAVGGAWGTVMAWGRVVLLAHWLSDVIAGWCLGMIVLVIALRIASIQTTLDDVRAALAARRLHRS